MRREIERRFCFAMCLFMITATIVIAGNDNGSEAAFSAKDYCTGIRVAAGSTVTIPNSNIFWLGYG